MILPCTKQRIRLDPAAYEELRRQVLKRDGWRCQACARRSRYPEPSERILGRLEFLAYSSFQWTFQERGRSWHDPVETGLSFPTPFHQWDRGPASKKGCSDQAWQTLPLMQYRAQKQPITTDKMPLTHLTVGPVTEFVNLKVQIIT